MDTLLSNFVCWIKTGVISAFNFISDGIAAAAQAGIDALPSMPAAPDYSAVNLPGGAHLGTVTAWVNYLVPVGTMLEVLTTVTGFIVVLWVANIILRAVKAQQ